jgi:hypothetical protein
MLELLKVLKKAEMNGRYLKDADVVAQLVMPQAGQTELDIVLVNELEVAVLRASGGKQSIEMQAQVRHFAKSCVGPDGITFDLVQILKDAKMHGDQDCEAAFHVLSQCLPPRSVWTLVWAARTTLGCVVGKRWHIYVDPTECRPTWVKQHEMCGKVEKVIGMDVDAGHWVTTMGPIS